MGVGGVNENHSHFAPHTHSHLDFKNHYYFDSHSRQAAAAQATAQENNRKTEGV